MANRKVKFRYYKNRIDDSDGILEEEGEFLEFGIDSFPYSDDIALVYTTAIIEKKDGYIIDIPIKDMQFIK